METILYVMILATLIVLLIMLSKKKQKPKSSFDKLKDNPVVKENKKLFDLQNQMIDKMKSTDQDFIPWGIGEFGYDVTNPIPTHTSFGNIYYLSRLRTMKGEKVKYIRIGSTSAKNILNPIDIYEISDSEGEICTLYISMYHKKTSKRAPSNFYLEKRIL